MEKWFDKIDKRWRVLPVEKQQKYILYFFVGYLLLTIGVLFKVWYDTNKANNSMDIEHIENPVLKEKGSSTLLNDTVSIILKNRIYERK